jgi:hypothetical protein
LKTKNKNYIFQHKNSLKVMHGLNQLNGDFMRLSLYTIIYCLCFLNTVYASNGTYCKALDETISLEVNLFSEPTFGNPLKDGNVSVEIKRDQLIVGLVSYYFNFKKGEIPNWYNLNGELKMVAHAEPDSINGEPLSVWVAMSVEVEATFINEIDGPGYYIGKYKVTQSSNSSGPGFLQKSFEGKITCELL